jgi:hypothetical protein
VSISSADLKSVEQSRDYDAVEQYWNLLVRASIRGPQGDEFQRINALVSSIPLPALAEWLSMKEVDTLLDLNPPLESLMTSPHERLAKEAPADVAAVRKHRPTDTLKATCSLLRVLRRIRNKRVHGFKAPGSPRDVVILGAARKLLAALCEQLAAPSAKKKGAAGIAAPFVRCWQRLLARK